MRFSYKGYTLCHLFSEVISLGTSKFFIHCVYKEMAKPLEDLTVPELRAKARAKHLHGYSSLSKKDLLKLLRGKKSRKSRKSKPKKSRKSKRKSKGSKKPRKSRKGKGKSKKSRKSKRKPKSKSKSKKSRRKPFNVYSPSAGCKLMTSKKYTSRPSPPFPANKCKGAIKSGNDGKIYKSTINSAGIHTWRKMPGQKKNATPKHKVGYSSVYVIAPKVYRRNSPQKFPVKEKQD
jgi:hypothetical protein